jgi:FMN phosphatase YigB (HAD superfamily)
MHPQRLVPARLLLALFVLATAGPTGADPLPAWRDSATKQRILNFVTATSTPGAPTWVTPTDRIAVFDDDGTLWPEKPRMQGLFALQRLRAVAPTRPDWQLRLPFLAALELGPKYLQEATDGEVLQLLAEAHAGRSAEQFRGEARSWLESATHPRFGRRWSQLVYQPMRELVAHLRANGFRVFVVSGGSAEVSRELVELALGLPGDDVTGSQVVSRLRPVADAAVPRLELERQPLAHALAEGPAKVQAYDLLVGRRPLLAVGNVHAGADIELLRYSQGNRVDGPPTVQLLIQHDDFEREYAYDEPDMASVNAANTSGWLLVSMRYDWLQLFAGN